MILILRCIDWYNSGLNALKTWRNLELLEAKSYHCVLFNLKVVSHHLLSGCHSKNVINFTTLSPTNHPSDFSPDSWKDAWDLC